MPMMVKDGSLGVKQLMTVLLDQDFGKDASKNGLNCRYFEPRTYQPSVTTAINLLLIHSIMS
jgi:hypothetical protein